MEGVKQDAVEALRSALAAVGVSWAQPDPGAMRADLVIEAPGGGVFELEVFAVSVATTADVDRIAHWRGEGVVPILVADEVPDAIRHELDERNLGWLDRRGGLRIDLPGCSVRPLGQP